MKIQLASDLHLEFTSKRFPGARLVEPAPDADVLVLAGDIHNGAQAVAAFADWPVPVFMLAGNHEHYGGVLEQTADNIRRAAAGTSVRFFENESIEVGDVRLLFATLWTDFQLRGHDQATSMREVGRGLNDYHLIRSVEGLRHRGEDYALLRPEDTLAVHQASRQWLERELATPWHGVTVVVTHHAPHPMSIAPEFAESRLNAGFASDLTPLLRKADLWLHGHMHSSSRYRVGGCQVVANPAGYVLNVASAKTPGELRLENGAFDRTLVIDTDSLATRRMAMAELGKDLDDEFMGASDTSLAREALRVIEAASDLSGDRDGALLWYRNEPLAVFGNKTAEQLVAEGRTDDVLTYIASIGAGAAG